MGRSPRPRQARVFSRKEVAWNPHVRGADTLAAQPRAGRGKLVGSKGSNEIPFSFIRPGKGKKHNRPARVAPGGADGIRPWIIPRSESRSPQSNEGPSRPQYG